MRRRKRRPMLESIKQKIKDAYWARRAKKEAEKIAETIVEEKIEEKVEEKIEEVKVMEKVEVKKPKKPVDLASTLDFNKDIRQQLADWLRL